MAKGCRLDALKTQRTMGITELAKAANVSDWTIRNLEAGGACEVVEAKRISDALGIALVTLGQANLQ